MNFLIRMFFIFSITIGSSFSFIGISNYMKEQELSYENACETYPGYVTENFAETLDQTYNSYILLVEYLCKRNIFISEMQGTKPSIKVLPSENAHSAWLESSEYRSSIARLEQSVVSLLTEGDIDERFFNFVTVSAFFKEENFEAVQLAYIKLRHKEIYDGISDGLSYKDLGESFEGITGVIFENIALHYAQKGMKEEVERVIFDYEQYPVVAEYHDLEAGERVIYLSRIKGEADKLLQDFAQRQQAAGEAKTQLVEQEIPITKLASNLEVTTEATEEEQKNNESNDSLGELVEIRNDGNDEYKLFALVLTIAFVLIFLAVRRMKKP